MLYLAPPFGWCGPDREQRKRERFDRTGHRGPAATARHHQARSAGTSTETPVVDLKRGSARPIGWRPAWIRQRRSFHAHASLAALPLPASREAVPPCFPLGDRYAPSPIRADSAKTRTDPVDTEHLFGFIEGADIGRQGERRVVIDSAVGTGKCPRA